MGWIDELYKLIDDETPAMEASDDITGEVNAQSEKVLGRHNVGDDNNGEIDLLTRIISSHMGIWNKDFNDNEVLPIPKDKYERFVHMCDYLSSKKFINVEFDDVNIKY